MALAYPVRLIPDDNHTVRMEFPEFLEANTFGADADEELAHAEDAQETVVDAYIRDRRPSRRAPDRALAD